MTVDCQQFLPTLIKSALNAGAAIMDVYKSDFVVRHKNDDSPVTIADERAEDIINAAISDFEEPIPVIGEEGVAKGHVPDISGGLFFLVDPLDGTKNFIRKGTDFTVNIGLIENNTPIMGIIYVPYSDVLYYGIVGDAAYKINDASSPGAGKVAITTRKTDPDNIVILASHAHLNDETRKWLDHYPGAEQLGVGSSLKFCLLAEGKADLYPRLGPTCEWDTAAGQAILMAAGGDVLGPDGESFSYRKRPDFLNTYFFARGDKGLTIPLG
jgi:3'(2'), 5'-bisphosphate nucleotidase